MKTSELIGPALDWAVAKCEGSKPYVKGYSYSPSTDWSQGGQIIEREKIAIWKSNVEGWGARHDPSGYFRYGPTPLVAAMRCYVASKLGDEVEIPEELL